MEPLELPLDVDDGLLEPHGNGGGLFKQDVHLDGGVVEPPPLVLGELLEVLLDLVGVALELDELQVRAVEPPEDENEDNACGQGDDVQDHIVSPGSRPCAREGIVFSEYIPANVYIDET